MIHQNIGQKAVLERRGFKPRSLVTTVRARIDSFTELPVSSYSLTPWTGLTGQIGIYSFRACLQSIPLDIAFRFKSSANTIPASLHNWLATL